MNKSETNGTAALTIEQQSFALREELGRKDARKWIAVAGHSMALALRRITGDIHKTTASRWLNGEISAAHNEDARQVLEYFESKAEVPIGDVALAEINQVAENDDHRAQLNQLAFLRAANQHCLRFPARLVVVAGEQAVPARNSIAKYRTAASLNVLLYMMEAMLYATKKTLSADALELAIERVDSLREAALPAIAECDRDESTKRTLAAKAYNYAATHNAYAASLLGAYELFDDYLPHLVLSLTLPTRFDDGVFVNAFIVSEMLLSLENYEAAEFYVGKVIETVLNLGDQFDSDMESATAMAQRAIKETHCLLPKLRDYAAQHAPVILPACSSI